MSVEFDPYQEWLSIPQNERPANYYRLLGLPLFESNLNVISNAADRQMAFVRTFQTGPYSQQSQQILNELAQARITLLDKQKKAQYDAKLRTSAYTTPPNLTPSGAIGEMQSAPPPAASSLTPQPWSNNSVSGSKSHVTPPGNTTVPPVPDSTNPTLAFLKKHWIAVLIALVAVQFIVCGGGLLAYLLKPSSTQIAQNQTTQQTQKEDEKAAPSEAQRLAEQYYKQSVDLQEKENYDEALSKITVAVELQPENEVYKAQQQALTRLIKSLGKTNKTSADSEKTLKEETLVSASVNTDSSKEHRNFDGIKIAGDRAVIVINGVEFAFRWCPAGTFMMGDNRFEESAIVQNEILLLKDDGTSYVLEVETKPCGIFDELNKLNNDNSDMLEKKQVTEVNRCEQHKVTLTKGFWIMETEVTQKHWKAIMGNNPSSFKGDDLPVECVSWDDCQDFCRKCVELGFPVRLPTEAQWEYACRAGSSDEYEDNLDEIAWYELNSEGKTHPVGMKKPNAWGLYDMHGNVLEWCVDRYGDYSKESGTDPTGALYGTDRVVRGGGWYYDAKRCQSTFRINFEPEGRFDDLGFRVVKGQDN